MACSFIAGNWAPPTTVEHDFIQAFCKWQNCTNAFPFQNSRSALSFALSALDLSPSDEVIISPYSCVVVYNAVKYTGAKAVICDIELETLSLDLESFKNSITTKTRTVILPHLMGFPAKNTLAIKTICQQNNILLIEDCAQAQGAEIEGKKVGNLGDMAFFSFEYSKIMSTSNGGMLVCNNRKYKSALENKYYDTDYLPKDAEQQILELGLYKYRQYKLREKLPPRGAEAFNSTMAVELRHEKPQYYGFKLCPIFAAIGLEQLKKTDQNIAMRRKNAGFWKKKLAKNHDIQFLKPQPNTRPVYLRLPFYVSPEIKLSGKYNQINGFSTGRWYSTLLDPADVAIENVPNAVAATQTILNLPTILR